MEKATVIIQARMGSKRLPGKVLMDIEGKTMLEHVIERAGKAQSADKVILALSEAKDSDVLEEFAQQKNIWYFRASEQDVLKRYYQTAQRFECRTIVRITSDCPLIDPAVIDLAVGEHFKQGNDLTSNMLKNTFPLGVAVEVLNFSTLKIANQQARKQRQREHVISYIYEHPEFFQIQNIQAKGILSRPDIRLTVDQQEDLDLVRTVFQAFAEKEFLSMKQVIHFLDKHPELLLINADIQQK